MSFTRTYIKERNFILTLVRDGANNESLKKHVQALTTESEDMHPFVELADASELTDISGFTKDGMVVAASNEIDRQPYQKDKLAILVASDEVYALAHQYGAISAYLRYDVKVFREYQPALEWLGVLDLENEINELRKN